MNKHAIVVGGSMAGLLAARVLSERFERVTLVERDVFPAAGEPRRGVPQGRHTHALLASGRNVLEELFPGISNELIAAGAVPSDIARDVRWFFEGADLARAPSDLIGLGMGRPLLEGVVRGRVLSLSNIDVRQGAQVETLASSPERALVTGVTISGETLAADLTVDATGRGSRAGK